MMTVSAFGSSMALVCPSAVLVLGHRLVAVTDVTSRYLNFFVSEQFNHGFDVALQHCIDFG
jgi:hypothetical protein